MRVELRGIRKYFGSVKANDGISMTLESGRIYGLLGENGAGKSTLMKILSGYQPPDSGTILLNDQSALFDTPAAALASGVGMVYQDPHDFPPFRVIDNYLLGRKDSVALNFRQAKKELRELGKRYGFAIDPEAQVDSLSLGERQQLELIRLLAGGAQVLILDEPTTGISAEQKEVLFDSMQRLAHEEGKTILLVSHKLEEVQELCGYAYILRRGKLVGETEVPCFNEHLVEMMFGRVPERPRRLSVSTAEPALEVRNLSVSTYHLDLANINLTVNKGEIFGLAGLEGSGQRLLQRTCAGLLSPDSGQIIVDGEDITHHSYHQRKRDGLAYIPAGRLEEGLVAGLTLTEHVLLAQPKPGFMIDWSDAREDTTRRISEYEVVGTPTSYAEGLSGGNQQRLLFALLESPLKLILLEHPTRGLDVRSADWIWEKLYQRRQDGTAILFMSADLDEVIDRSDRIAVFFGGRMSRIVDADKTSVEELGHLIGGEE